MSTKKMTADRAAAIVNDIHEGMCRASRAELMAVASFYAIEASKLYSEAGDAYARCLTNAFEQYTEFKKRTDVNFPETP